MLSLCQGPPGEVYSPLRGAVVDVNPNEERSLERVSSTPPGPPHFETTYISCFLANLHSFIDFLTSSFFPYFLAFCLKKSFLLWGHDFK